MLLQFVSKKAMHITDDFHQGIRNGLRLRARRNSRRREQCRHKGLSDSLFTSSGFTTALPFAVFKRRSYLQTFSRLLPLNLEVEKEILDEKVFFVQAMFMERYVERRAPLVKSFAWLHRVLPVVFMRV